MTTLLLAAIVAGAATTLLRSARHLTRYRAEWLPRDGHRVIRVLPDECGPDAVAWWRAWGEPRGVDFLTSSEAVARQRFDQT